mgnify:CR=1 FL=1
MKIWRKSDDKSELKIQQEWVSGQEIKVSLQWRKGKSESTDKQNKKKNLERQILEPLSKMRENLER